MSKRYVVRLADEERQQPSEMVSKGKAAADKIKHANILLKVDVDGPVWTDEQVAIERKKQAKRSREFACDGEARLTALRRGQAPDGFARWSLRLLAGKAVELETEIHPLNFSETCSNSRRTS